MTNLFQYRNVYIPVKDFLISSRALADAEVAIRNLEEISARPNISLSNWKIYWVSACALLRSSIDTFKIDAKSCLNEKLRIELKAEWDIIKTNKADHDLFWNFIRKERDNILHQYEIGAYQIFLDREGKELPKTVSLISIITLHERSVFKIRVGHFAGQDALTLLKQSAEWVEARIHSAIERAGFTPEERRNIATFEQLPAKPSLLSAFESDRAEAGES